MKLGILVFSLLAAATQANAFIFDSTMPADQVASIKYDQAYLQKLQFLNNAADQETARLMGIEGPLTPSSLQAWMDERVNAVISENIDLKSTVMGANGTVYYPDAILPDVETPTKTAVSKPSEVDPNAKAPQTFEVMSNIGSALYEMGKKLNVLVVLQFPETDGSAAIVPLESPHHGVIQVGLGLFLKGVVSFSDQQNTPANAIARLAVFFHESRHSDGHAKSLGFSHSVCPAGNNYAGYPACDKSLNGAYTVGASVLKSMTQACTECSVRDVTILHVIQADSESRIQHTYNDASGNPQVATNLDATPEKILGFIPASAAPAPAAPASAPAASSPQLLKSMPANFFTADKFTGQFTEQLTDQ